MNGFGVFRAETYMDTEDPFPVPNSPDNKMATPWKTRQFYHLWGLKDVTKNKRATHHLFDGTRKT